MISNDLVLQLSGSQQHPTISWQRSELTCGQVFSFGFLLGVPTWPGVFFPSVWHDTRLFRSVPMEKHWRMVRVHGHRSGAGPLWRDIAVTGRWNWWKATLFGSTARGLLWMALWTWIFWQASDRLLVNSGKKFYDLIMIKVRLSMVKYRAVSWVKIQKKTLRRHWT